MQIFFIALTIVSFGYFLIARRTFDFFSIAIISGFFYFYPGLLGHALNPYLEKIDSLTPLHYIIMDAYFFIFLFAAILKDIMFQKKPLLQTSSSAQINNENYKYQTYSIWALLIFSFAYIIYSLGADSLSTDKLHLINKLGSDFSIFMSITLISLLYSFKKNWPMFALVILALLYTLFIGYRFIFVIGFLSLVILLLNPKSKKSLIKDGWAVLLIFALVAIALTSYRYVYPTLKTGNIQGLLNEGFNYEEVINHTEPMVIQENLNMVIKHDFKVNPQYLINNLAALLIPFSSKLGYLKAVNFNELIQPVFYAGYKYGVAGNIWAEMMAIGGMPLVIIFMLLLAAICFYLSVMISHCSDNLLTLIIPAGVFLFFYIHRNDLLFTLYLIRNIILVWVLVNCFNVVMNYFANRRKLYQ